MTVIGKKSNGTVKFVGSRNGSGAAAGESIGNNLDAGTTVISPVRAELHRDVYYVNNFLNGVISFRVPLQIRFGFETTEEKNLG